MRLHGFALCTASVTASLLATTVALAQDRDWSPVGPQLSQIFEHPFAKGSFDTFSGGQRLSAFQATDFENCNKALVEPGGMSYGLFDKDIDVHAAVHPEAADAMGDMQIYPYGDGFKVFQERRFWGGAPETLIIDSLDGAQLSDGSLLLRVTSRHDVETENKTYEVIPADETVSYARMMTTREADGVEYLMLAMDVAPSGQATTDTVPYFSCLVPD